MTTDKDEIERGSGNVFADLRLLDAEAYLRKAQLVNRIDEIIRRRSPPASRSGQAARAVATRRVAPVAGRLSGALHGAPADGVVTQRELALIC